jgi:hypothetical protein
MFAEVKDGKIVFMGCLKKPFEALAPKGTQLAWHRRFPLEGCFDFLCSFIQLLLMHWYLGRAF